MGQSNLETSEELLLSVWNDRDFSVIDKYVHPHHVNHDPTGETEGIQAYKDFGYAFTNAFPDIHATINDSWEDDDTTTMQVTFRGTHQGELMGVPATGKSIVVDVTITDRYENGMLVESWGEWDPNDMMRQLGVG